MSRLSKVLGVIVALGLGGFAAGPFSSARAGDAVPAIDSPSRLHILPPEPGEGRPTAVPRRWVSSNGRFVPEVAATTGGAQSAAVPGPAAAAIFYPADLAKGGGATMVTAKQHLVYVNCTPASTCWGNPATFVTDLNTSSFITITNQYVGSSATNRYPLGLAKNASWALATTTTDAVIRSKLDAFVVANGKLTGNGNLYHVFLKQGQNVCFDSGLTQCYSPGNSSTFYFCGYHSYFYSSAAGGYVIYSVEPYQKVPGCQTMDAAGAPNLTYSTASTLSHEIFEAITDPYLNAWYVPSGLLLAGNEIGDVCVWRRYGLTIGAHAYVTQLEYSNLSHACKSVP